MSTIEASATTTLTIQVPTITTAMAAALAFLCALLPDHADRLRAAAAAG